MLSYRPAISQLVASPQTPFIAKFKNNNERTRYRLCEKETKEGWTKVSLRSKNIDIIPAALYFGGGGHTFAAGCTIKKPLKIAAGKLLERLEKEL